LTKISLGVFNTQPPHLYFGGVERRIMETAHMLQDNVATTVYAGTKAGFKKPISMEGTTIIPCFSTDTLFPVDNWFFNRTLSDSAEAIEAEVYEIHTVSGFGFMKTARRRHLKKTIIHTIHGVLADEYAQSFQSGSMTLRARIANRMMEQLAKLEKETAQNADLIVTVSKYSSRKATQFYGIDQTKTRVVPNGVDPKKFRPFNGLENIKRQIGIEGKLCVLFVGRLIPRKGLPYLIEAASNITKQIDETAFVIVGDGPLRKHLMSYAERLNLSEKFAFLGDVNENILPSLYNCADVFVLPSIQEGQGIALLEAQATAKPVVAFNVGGVPEAILEGQTGLLTKPDSLELSNALLKLLSDRSLRERMGGKGRDFVVDHFSWDICARRMMQVYREARALTA